MKHPTPNGKATGVELEKEEMDLFLQCIMKEDSRRQSSSCCIKYAGAI